MALFHAFIWIAFGEQRALFTKPVMDVHGLQATSARMIIAIFCGPAAVNVFFVLSGFVLARSLRKTSPGIAMYARYIVKRGFRIFPALIVSIGLALLYRAMLYPGYEVFPIASTWFNWWYKASSYTHLAAPLKNQ
ncbi:acyltransferase family protein [Ralstonia solanacearum]|uniref:acyltransferase family protein n=1 Tax=Ralstonia solanacearum species complex TaxID=3116862 RepID=UPI001FF9FDB4